MIFFDVLGWSSFNFFDVNGFYDVTIKTAKDRPVLLSVSAYVSNYNKNFNK